MVAALSSRCARKIRGFDRSSSTLDLRSGSGIPWPSDDLLRGLLDSLLVVVSPLRRYRLAPIRAGIYSGCTTIRPAQHRGLDPIRHNPPLVSSPSLVSTPHRRSDCNVALALLHSA